MAERATLDTLNVRGIDTNTASEIKAQARARGITVGVYIERLVALAAACRKAQFAEIDKLVADAGLGPITY